MVVSLGKFAGATLGGFTGAYGETARDGHEARGRRRSRDCRRDRKKKREREREKEGGGEFFVCFMFPVRVCCCCFWNVFPLIWLGRVPCS